MKRCLSYSWVLALLFIWSCGSKDDDPNPAQNLPSYLRVPANLNDYKGSGLITVTGGGLNLRAEGPESIDGATQTYQGVSGDISGEDINAMFTVGQPRVYEESNSVPREYRANGWLMIYNTITPGTYGMGIDATVGPKGEVADLILNLPGPQLYTCNLGSLTIAESTLIKTQGAIALYRVNGSFQTSARISGIGNTGNAINIAGTFDLLLVK